MEERKIKDSKKSDFFYRRIKYIKSNSICAKNSAAAGIINNKIFCILNPNRKVDCVVVFFKR